jgi:hypothetical protein
VTARVGSRSTYTACGVEAQQVTDKKVTLTLSESDG